MKKLFDKIASANKLKIKTDAAYDNVIEELLQYFSFWITENEDFFFIEYQPSDGMVLADAWSNVYDLRGILAYIQKYGKIASYDDLKQFSI